MGINVCIKYTKYDSIVKYADVSYPDNYGQEDDKYTSEVPLPNGMIDNTPNV